MSTPSTQTTDQASIIDLIKKDHATIVQLYAQFNNTTDAVTKLQLGQELIRAICVHSSAEEMVVYPLVDTDLGKDSGDHSREEHLAIEKLLYQIDSAPKVDENYATVLSSAMKLLQQHVSEEENVIMPKLAAKHTAQELCTIGNRFTTVKATAPTHPHPAAPKTGLTGIAAKVTAKPLDEMKDVLAGTRTSAVEETK